MYAGNLSRKEQLVRHGFRLPSAVENRPLRADEFWHKVPQAVFVSATPGSFELNNSAACAKPSSSTGGEDEASCNGEDFEDRGVFSGKVDAVIRPTGVLDPEIEVVPSAGQVDHMLVELAKVVAQGERAIVTTLTKKSAEDLAVYLRNQPPVGGTLGRPLAVSYLHSGISSVERMEILDAMRSPRPADVLGGDDIQARQGNVEGGDGDELASIDVLVGVNLLREGISLPSVSLVCIVDADKEGFLRSTSALIQTVGRAARNVNGKVFMYADKHTKAMKAAVRETNRRRKLQLRYNRINGITPATVVSAKTLQNDADVETLIEQVRRTRVEEGRVSARQDSENDRVPVSQRSKGFSDARQELMGFSEAELEAVMEAAVEKEQFEYAAEVRDYLLAKLGR